MRYTDIFRDELKRPLVGAKGFVYLIDGVSLATGLTADNGAVIANPVVADTLGTITFNGVGPEYLIDIFFAGKRVWREKIGDGLAIPGPTGDGVSTYSALAGVNAVNGDAAILTEGLRAGTFIYRAGNFTASITADPLQGLYVPTTADPTGATGAWVRQVGAHIKPQWFGALGNGTTDDTAALQACVTASAGRRILLIKTSYKITTSLKITKALTLDFEPGATLLLATQNMNGIEIGDGTEATRNTTFGTVINNPAFNPFAGVAAFTSGACIKRNYVAYCHVNNLTVFGLDGAVKKLWNGVYDYRASECDAPNLSIQHVRNRGVHTQGDGTVPGRTVDNNYDFARIFSTSGDAIFIDEGCAGLGFYRPTMYGLGAGAWGIHVNCTPGDSGQNFFVDTPDIEVPPGSAGGIFVERGQRLISHGGWIGGTSGQLSIGIRIGAGADSCSLSTDLSQARMLIEGRHNIVKSCDIAGDITTVTDGLVITGADTTISSGVKIRQWGGNGIAWGGATPAGVVIGQLAFASNSTDIAPLTGFSATNAPVIAQGNTDKGRTVAAAATLELPISVPFMQVTGATQITSIPRRGVGSRVTLQAGAGGISLAAGGNLILPATPLAIAAFNTVSLVTDGASWFFDGKST